MKYFINCKGIGLEDDELLIDCELQVGDNCVIEIDTDNEIFLLVVKRTFYKEVSEWIFSCVLANEC